MKRRSWQAWVALAAALVLVPFGCGKPPAPRGPTLQEATGNATCHPAFDPFNPLVAEWPGASLSDLEVTSKRGVVVVAYDACTAQMKVLSQCRVGGGYDYVDALANPDTLTMRSDADVDANLPFAGVSLKAKLGVGRKLDFRYTSVGQRVATQAPTLLSGDCTGATHYVRAFTLGEYQLSSSLDVLASGGVDVLGKGASTTVQDASSVEKRGGEGCADAPTQERASRCAVLALSLSSLGVDGDAQAQTGGFGHGLGAVTAVPRVSTLADRPINLAGALRDENYIELLELLAAAKRTDKDSTQAPWDRAEAWNRVATHGGNNPLASQAAARRDEWKRFLEAKHKHGSQVVTMCTEREKDAKNLARLLALPDDTVTAAQKASLKREFDAAYASWRTDLGRCAEILEVSTRPLGNWCITYPASPDELNYCSVNREDCLENAVGMQQRCPRRTNSPSCFVRVVTARGDDVAHRHCFSSSDACEIARVPNGVKDYGTTSPCRALACTDDGAHCSF